MSITTTSRRLQAALHNSSREWFTIHAKTKTVDNTTRATVHIYAEIGDSFWGDSVSASEFVKQVSVLDVDEINLHLNSPGGDVYDGIAIANTIRQHKARVVVTVDGIAASAASFIAVAGDELVMAQNSELMIHDAWGMAVGNAEEMRELADRLDQVSDNIASMYAAKAGGDTAAWREVMRGEHWYSADEAVKAGLADRVDQVKTPPAEDEAKNRFDLRIFNHAGRAQAPPPPQLPAAEPDDATPTTPNPEGPAMSDNLTTGLRERLGIPAESELDEGGLLAALDEALAEVATPAAQVQPLPQGTVLVDSATLDELKAAAQVGQRAYERQQSDDRLAVVNAAVSDGRIAPARRDHWVASLAADPGAAEVLAQLQPGTVPVQAKGYTGGVDEAPDDDRIYSAAWPTGKD